MSDVSSVTQGAYLSLSKDEIHRRLDFHRRYKFHFQQFINGECKELEARMNRLCMHHPESRERVHAWIKELKQVRLAQDTRRLEELQNEYRTHTNNTGTWTLDL
mgnify:CR=1 FL=1